MESTGNYLLKKNRIRMEDTVLTVLSEQYDSDSVNSFLLHSHRYTEVFFCKESAFTICTEREPITVERGSAVIVPKGILHHVSELNMGFVSGVGVILEQAENEGGNRVLYDTFSAVFGDGGIRVVPNAEELYLELFQLLSMDDDASILMTMSRLFRAVKNCRCIRVSEPTSAPMRTVSERLIILDTILNAWFNRPLHAKEIAAMLYISERQLSRILAEHCGTTLQQMISEKRIAAAKSMLAESTSPVDEVGYEVGFRSRSGFYDEFRKQTGMTPAAFRNSVKKQGSIQPEQNRQ